MHPHVTFSHVGHTYTTDAGKSVTALENIDFTIQQGEFVAVLGPSGCGKSTLLRLLAGLFPATTGKISIFDYPIVGPQDNAGIVFQKPTLLPWKNVLQNVLFPIQYKHGRVSNQDKKLALDMLTLVGLEEFAQHMPDQLSGGMQQRVGIARALLINPEILIMDEPFSALDALTREQMGFELLDIWRQKPKTVLFITHSISEAVLLADKVLVLSPRPAKIVEQIDITLPRPRSLDTIKSPTFSNYTDQIRQVIYHPQSQTKPEQLDAPNA